MFSDIGPVDQYDAADHGAEMEEHKTENDEAEVEYAHMFTFLYSFDVEYYLSYDIIKLKEHMGFILISKL